MYLAVKTVERPPGEKKRQRKRQRWIKGTGRAFLGEEQAQDPELRSEEDCAWWSIGKGGKKGFSKDMKVFAMVVSNYPAEKVQAMISTRTKAEARTKKERARKVLIFNLDFQPLQIPLKRDKVIPGNQAIGIPALLTIPLVHCCMVWHGTHCMGWHQSL